MAEKNEETPDNLQEEVAAAASGDAPEAADEATPATGAEPAAGGDEAAAGGDEAAAGGDEAPAAKPKAAPRSGPTRAERLATKRAERRAAAGRRKPRSVEERAAERAERRANLAKQRRAYRQKVKAKAAAARTEQPVREPDHAAEHGPGRAKVRQGVVISDKGEKSITVAIDVVRRHKRYHKIMRSTVKLHAHDERNDAHEGDTVRVQECRPMSRTKRWRLVEILERAR